MATIVTNNIYYSEIASKIREKLASEASYRPADMASAIMRISSRTKHVRQQSVLARKNGFLNAKVGAGYSQITVDIDTHISSIVSSIYQNGTYTASANTAFTDIVVDIPQQDYELLSLSVSENGNYIPESGYLYSSVNVNIPQYSLSYLSISENGTYTHPNGVVYKSVFVDIPSVTSDYMNSLIFKNVVSISNSEVSRIGNAAFYRCSTLTNVDIPAASEIGVSAFQSCVNLTSISAPSIQSIGSYAFAYCSSVSEFIFPSCTHIGGSAFNGCYYENLLISVPNVQTLDPYAFLQCYITSATFSNLLTVPSNAFYNCTSLLTVDLPEATGIGEYAFRYCSRLTSASFPNVLSIDGNAFASCTLGDLNIYAPMCSYVGFSAFYMCLSMTSISLPECSFLGSYAFYMCRTLTSVSLPKVSTINRYTFYGCSSLSVLSLPACVSIQSSAFMNNYRLVSLYLMNNRIVALSNSAVFTSTPIAGYTEYTSGAYGSIFVPTSLLSSYLSVTNWAYFSSRFVGI